MIMKMKLLFHIQNEIHTFSIHDEITGIDTEVIKQSLMRFLNSDPTYVILDLSWATLELPETELEAALLEIKTYAQAKNINLVIARTDLESADAPQRVVELALEKRIQLLENKIDLRENLLKQTALLQKENQELREQREQEPADDGLSPIISPLVDRLWNNS